MRARTVLAAAATACVGLLALGGTASAAQGTFSYSFGGDDRLAAAELVDPADDTCIDLPEVAGEDEYAFLVRNHTNTPVIVFKEAGCEGPRYPLRAGGEASDRLLVKSVMFKGPIAAED